ncbi:unnamed protein product, partial [Staurois parvus]
VPFRRFFLHFLSHSQNRKLMEIPPKSEGIPELVKVLLKYFPSIPLLVTTLKFRIFFTSQPGAD